MSADDEEQLETPAQEPAEAEPAAGAEEAAAPVGGSDAEPESASEAGADGEPDAGGDDEPEAGADGEPEAESDDEPEAGADGEPEAGADDEVEAEADEDDEPEAEAQEDAEPEADEDASEEAAPKRRVRRRRTAKSEEPAEQSAKPARAPRRSRGKRDPSLPPPVVRAQARYVRSSARKARLVCDHIRGKTVEDARAILAVTPRAVARDWSKLLESAVANAEHNHELVGEDLYIKAVHADEGPTIKRFRPRAQGRATRIRKRTSHLTILLTPKD